MCKLILHVKQELDELDDLLNADSAIFSNTRWKVSTKVMLSEFNLNHVFTSSFYWFCYLCALHLIS